MLTVNVAVVFPAATVTLAGTVAAVLLLDSPTTDPSASAAPFNVTVPVEAVPAFTLAGFTLTPINCGNGTAAKLHTWCELTSEYTNQLFRLDVPLCSLRNA